MNGAEIINMNSLSLFSTTACLTAGNLTLHVLVTAAEVFQKNKPKMVCICQSSAAEDVHSEFIGA